MGPPACTTGLIRYLVGQVTSWQHHCPPTRTPLIWCWLIPSPPHNFSYFEPCTLNWQQCQFTRRRITTEHYRELWRCLLVRICLVTADSVPWKLPPTLGATVKLQKIHHRTLPWTRSQFQNLFLHYITSNQRVKQRDYVHRRPVFNHRQEYEFFSSSPRPVVQNPLIRWTPGTIRVKRGNVWGGTLIQKQPDVNSAGGFPYVHIRNTPAQERRIFLLVSASRETLGPTLPIPGHWGHFPRG
jgi:hypothetical protein